MSIRKKNSRRTDTTSSRTPSAEPAIDGLGGTWLSQKHASLEASTDALIASKRLGTETRRPTTLSPLSTQSEASRGGTSSLSDYSLGLDGRYYAKTPVTETRPEPRMNSAKPSEQSEEDVAHQRHYEALKIQPLEYIVANGFGYMEGNIVKYVSRYKLKGGKKDLLKAREYLNRLIKETT